MLFSICRILQPGAVYVSQSLQFKLPVYIGDEVVAEVRALNLRKIKNKHMSVSTIDTVICSLKTFAFTVHGR